MSAIGPNDGWHLVHLLGRVTDEVKELYPGLTTEEALKTLSVVVELLDNRPDGMGLGEAFIQRVYEEIEPAERNWASAVRLAVQNRSAT